MRTTLMITILALAFAAPVMGDSGHMDAMQQMRETEDPEKRRELMQKHHEAMQAQMQGMMEQMMTRDRMKEGGDS
jgi:hypothetical protein